MARPIKETPVVTGKDAKRFAEKIAHLKPESKEEREAAKKVYAKFKAQYTLVQDARLEDGAHIGVYRLDEHSEQAGKLVLSKPYVAVLQLDADCGVTVDVLQPGDGDISSV